MNHASIQEILLDEDCLIIEKRLTRWQIAPAQAMRIKGIAENLSQSKHNAAYAWTGESYVFVGFMIQADSSK